MKRVKRIIGTLCILFPVFLFLICGVMLIGISDDGEDGDPAHASGLGLSDKVREYAAFVGVSYRITCNNGNQRTLINP